MKKQGIAGSVLLMILGLFTILIPNFILPVCTGQMELASGSLAPMKCYYMASAEIVPGVIVIVCGLLMLLFKQHESKAAAGIIAAAAGVLVILLATTIIGACKNQAMACRMGSQPGLIVVGVLIIAAGTLSAIIQMRRSIKARK